jgi:hypothetical protein
MFDDEKDAESEQLLKEYRRVIAFLEANRVELEKRGMNVAEKLAQTKGDLTAFEKVCKETEQAQQGYLQATADLADKEFEVFKETSKMVDHLLDINSDDPDVQKLAQQRDSLKKQFPKE